jgi:hypothetical protein
MVLRMPLRDYKDLVFDYIVRMAQDEPLGLAMHFRYPDLKDAIHKAEESAAQERPPATP